MRVAEQTAADQGKLGKNLDLRPAVIAEIKRIQKPAQQWAQGPHPLLMVKIRSGSRRLVDADV
jgi:hypothetical protein